MQYYIGYGSAACVRLPPHILFKGKHLYSAWRKNGPAGAFYSVSESEWIEAPNFLSWFCKMFLALVSYPIGKWSSYFICGWMSLPYQYITH